MGHRDLVKLYEIVKYARELEKKFNWGYQFKWDQGEFETAILIHEDGWCGVPSKTLAKMDYYNIFCPDIVDFSNKIIIEFEEEAKPNTGYLRAKKHKGHFEGNKNDELRDLYYAKAKFNVLKVWESDKDWQVHLKEFLIRCRIEKNPYYKLLKEKLK